MAITIIGGIAPVQQGNTESRRISKPDSGDMAILSADERTLLFLCQGAEESVCLKIAGDMCGTVSTC